MLPPEPHPQIPAQGAPIVMEINPGVKGLLGEFIEQSGFVAVPSMNCMEAVVGFQQGFHPFFGNKMQTHQGEFLLQPTNDRGAKHHIADGA
jgi:hypothetical protein